MSTEVEQSGPTVGKAMVLLRKSLETKEFTSVPFVIQGFRNGDFTVDEEGAPMVQLLIQCLNEMNETAGAKYFQEQFEKVVSDSTSGKENMSYVSGSQDVNQSTKNDTQPEPGKKGEKRKAGSLGTSSNVKNGGRNELSDGTKRNGAAGMNTVRRGIDDDVEAGSVQDSTSDIHKEKRLRKSCNAKKGDMVDANIVVKNDYVESLEEMIRVRRGTLDYILPKKCIPQWKTWRQGSSSLCTVRVFLNHQNTDVKAAVKKNAKNSKDGPTANGEFVYGLGRFEDRQVVQGIGASNMAKRFASKMAIDALNGVVETVELNARILLGRTCDQVCQEWRRGLWSRTRFERALDSIKGVVNRADDGLLYGAKVYAYGSSTSGVALGDSDFDVCVVLPGSKHVDKAFFGKDFAIKCLKALQRQAITDRMKNVNLVASANVPVLKYHDVDVDMDIDVTFGSDESVLVARLIRQHVIEDVRIWNICLLVKQWAKNRLVCGAYEGYINSLGWVIMVIYFLQHVVKPRIASRYIFEKVNGVEGEGEIQEQYNLTKLPTWRKDRHSRARTSTILLHFFKFFAYEFDFSSEAISLRLNKRSSIGSIVAHPSKWSLFIEHPLKKQENLVGYVEAHGMKTISEELKRAAEICKTQGDLTHVLSRKRH